ncbi:ABC transporter ATP-binding protein [Methanimicrococcus blatticola]|uniref:ATP-binding cassette subfamily B protein n=1 Tax=Methanimicrococcus blatticola TaxID=91560 RepID=A0A484F722_9EURY|nr:ABC transporter ATP-binding protein [Methanimicrococcus blatticola]MBZ3934851.1 ABC transporter ATP-binding protein/permease [Methanimicrococcus blatticola]MCC2509051.1 ABC transporter ATP-binding protein/permease [Methanimicrococcus blatticola]TDQ70925.1 ATP-binding cassette subfamily B protein [Methanimicrococcus blatticola]
MKKLFGYLKPYKLYITAAVFLIFLQCLTQLLLPDLMARMVDIGIVGGDISYIYTMGVYMLVVTVFSMIFSIAAGYFTSKTSAGFAKLLRKDLFDKTDSFSLEEFDKFGTSTLVTRTTNDVNQLQNVIMMMLRVVVVAPLTFLGSILLMMNKDITLSLVVLAVIPLLILFVYVVSRQIIPAVQEMQRKLDSVSRILRERLTGVRVIRAFNKEEAATRQYEAANDDLTAVSLKVNRIAAVLFPGMLFLMNLATIAVLWVGSFRIESANFTVGDMMAFIQYVTMIMMSVVMISIIFVILPRAKVSADRILEVLNTEQTVLDPENEAEFVFTVDENQPAVEFKNVSFRYSDSDKMILKHISFSINRGETAAVIGGTGSGKTSLVSLIPRFYDVADGAVYVDGFDIRDIKQADLRRRIGFVPQTAVLFSGTIADNLRYGKDDATEEEIWKALEIAQASEFVENMEEGIYSYISQGGTNVSGGQKQRLTIARAIVKKPEIYIFDDNFSALDYKTDANLRSALQSEIKDAAVLIVAQRVATIRNVSKIIVLDNGEIAGIGTDTELMANCEVYRQIVASQNGSAEAAE